MKPCFVRTVSASWPMHHWGYDHFGNIYPHLTSSPYIRNQGSSYLICSLVPKCSKDIGNWKMRVYGKPTDTFQSGCQLNPKGCWIDTTFLPLATIWHPLEGPSNISLYICRRTVYATAKQKKQTTTSVLFRKPKWQCKIHHLKIHFLLMRDLSSDRHVCLLEFSSNFTLTTT